MLRHWAIEFSWNVCEFDNNWMKSTCKCWSRCYRYPPWNWHSAPETRPFVPSRKGLSPKHHFSGVLLVSGRVYSFKDSICFLVELFYASGQHVVELGSREILWRPWPKSNDDMLGKQVSQCFTYICRWCPCWFNYSSSSKLIKFVS